MTKENQLLADAVASINYHSMATIIRCEKMEDGLITVNDKEVRRDMDGTWTGRHLNATEAKYFNMFLQTLERAGKQLKVAVYRT